MYKYIISIENNIQMNTTPLPLQQYYNNSIYYLKLKCRFSILIKIENK